MIQEISEALRNWLSPEHVLGVTRAVILLAVGLLLSRLAASTVGQLATHRFAQQQTLLIKRATRYLVLLIFLAASLRQIGFDLGVLLGAAGILSVAVGFASQTSASNLISGLFLIAERPFGIGDVIEVNGTAGEVLSIDLLSVKLRTFDNLFVRIPNETMIKTEVRTLTKFPIRRADIKIGVAYKEDIASVRDILLDVAQKNPLALEEPKPTFIFLGLGPSSKDFQFSPWAKQESFLEMRNSLHLEIQQRFEEEGIEIPYPHVSIEPSSAARAFELQMRPSEDPLAEPSSKTS